MGGLGSEGCADGVGEVGGGVSAEVEGCDEEVGGGEEEGGRGMEGGGERGAEDCGERVRG